MGDDNILEKAGHAVGEVAETAVDAGKGIVRWVESFFDSDGPKHRASAAVAKRAAKPTTDHAHKAAAPDEHPPAPHAVGGSTSVGASRTRSEPERRVERDTRIHQAEPPLHAAPEVTTTPVVPIGDDHVSPAGVAAGQSAARADATPAHHEPPEPVARPSSSPPQPAPNDGGRPVTAAVTPAAPPQPAPKPDTPSHTHTAAPEHDPSAAAERAEDAMRGRIEAAADKAHQDALARTGPPTPPERYDHDPRQDNVGSSPVGAALHMAPGPVTPHGPIDPADGPGRLISATALTSMPHLTASSPSPLGIVAHSADGIVDDAQHDAQHDAHLAAPIGLDPITVVAHDAVHDAALGERLPAAITLAEHGGVAGAEPFDNADPVRATHPADTLDDTAFDHVHASAMSGPDVSWTPGIGEFDHDAAHATKGDDDDSDGDDDDQP